MQYEELAKAVEQRGWTPEEIAKEFILARSSDAEA
jgi:hypothetical protein